MKKSNITTIFFLVVTFGLVGAIAYFSMLLSNKGGNAITQIKRTKASAQTYHKLFELENSSEGGTVTPIQVPEIYATPQSSTAPSAAPTLLVLNNITPTVIPSPTVLPTVTPSPTNIPSTPTSIPTPTIALLAYRTTTITPTLIPVTNTGGEQIKMSPTAVTTPTKTPTPANKLPETGWVQLSTILFIVAATTVFVSFLF